MTMAAEAKDYSGLYNVETQKAACPLQRVEAHAVIGDGQAVTRVTQYYRNGTGAGLEALYRFPLPYDSVITRFSARVGEAAVEGKLCEKEQARKRYEEAVRAGDAAMLLQRNSPDVFDIAVGNIADGEEAEITIEYWQNLREVDGVCRYALPTALAPRYVPDHMRGVAEKILPNLGETEYRLSFTADIDVGSRFTGAVSPSHDVAVSVNSEGRPSAALRSPALLDGDLLLDVSLRAAGTDAYSAEEGQDGNYLQVKFTVEADDDQPKANPREYVFVLDASGSMDGEKIAQAKRALSLCLRNLMDGDRFNLIAFGSDFRCFSERSVAYDQASMAQADRWLSAVGSMGGTEILAPLRQVYAGDAALPREILLFTDGQVGNERQIIDLVKQHSGGTRFFPFGIDTAVNRHFIDSLAKAGGGEPEYIHPGERIDDKVIRQFSRIGETPVTDVRFEGAHPSGTVNLRNASPAASVPSTLYAGEEYSFCFNLGFRPVPQSVTVSGRVGAQPFAKEIPLGHSIGWQGISKRWARERIAFLEAGDVGGNRAEIVDVSLQYGVISTHTSYLAHIGRKDKITGRLETVVVPSALPALWEEQNMPRLARSVSSVAGSMASLTNRPIRSSPAVYNMVHASVSQFDVDAADASLFIAPKQADYKAQSGDPLKEAVRDAALLQKADGSAGNDTRSTAAFLLGMLLSGESQPMRNQLKKAAEYLLGHTARAGLTEAIAVELAARNKLADAARCAGFVAEVTRRLDAKEKQLFDEARAGRIGKAFDLADNTAADRQVLALALLNMV